MRTIDEYLDLAIARCDLPSDRQLSIKMGLSPAALSRFRRKRDFPSDDTMLALAALAGVAESEALIDLNYWRAKSPAARSTYERIAARLNGAAVTGALLLMLFAPVSSDARTDGAQRAIGAFQNIYYAIFLWLRRRPAAVTMPLSSK